MDHIDLDLYSRTVFTVGLEAMISISKSHVFLIGLGGLGAEIAKNLLLSGVRHLTIFANETVDLKMLASHMYVSEKDIGRGVEVCLDKLKDLNPSCTISIIKGEISQKDIQECHVIIDTSNNAKDIDRHSEMARDSKKCYVHAVVFGAFGRIFSDFGNDFVVKDKTGLPLKQYLVTGITKKDNTTLVTLNGSDRISEDSFVHFLNVKGMTQMNQIEKIRVISVKDLIENSKEVELDLDSSSFGEYITGGGIMEEVREPSTLHFRPYSQQKTRPQYTRIDLHYDYQNHMHLCFESLLKFNDQKYDNNNSEGAKMNIIQNICEELNGQWKLEERIDKELLEIISCSSEGIISPMVSIIGGIASQEALKAISAKYQPIQQFFYFGDKSIVNMKDRKNSQMYTRDDRYLSNAILFGNEIQELISKAKIFLVGCGAIGCELLKIYSLMGLGEKGKLYVTDNDKIERSNLSRQFLFRAGDIESFKSVVGAREATKMNPHHQNIQPFTYKVEPSNSFFDEEFFRSIDCVSNALDNINARKYMNKQCIQFFKPMFDPGTLGTKGSCTTVLPGLTEQYSAIEDEKEEPFCTIHFFPTTNKHAITWTTGYIFGESFDTSVEYLLKYLENKESFLKDMVKRSPAEAAIMAEHVDRFHCSGSSRVDFMECVLWARNLFDDLFDYSIQKYLEKYPKDGLDENNQPYWGGKKVCPVPLSYDLKNEWCRDFVHNAAKIRAVALGIQVDESCFKKVDVEKLATYRENNEKTKKKYYDKSSLEISQILSSSNLTPLHSLNPQKITPIKFEKDSTTNHHVEFVTASSNLRCLNYNIPILDHIKTKEIAGKIIPAIITSTSVVAGLISLQLIKWISKNRTLECYHDYSFDLAFPMNFSGWTPRSQAKMEVNKNLSVGIWDFFEFGDITVKKLLEHFKEKYDLTVSMVLVNNQFCLYPNLKGDDSEIIGLKISDLAIQKGYISSNVKSFFFQILVEDESEKESPVLQAILKVSK